MWCSQEGASFMKVLALFIQEDDSRTDYNFERIESDMNMSNHQDSGRPPPDEQTFDFKSRLIGTETPTFGVKS